MELIKSILGQLGVNSTFYYQFALVVLTYFVFSNLVLKPLLKILSLRKEKTKGYKELSENLLKEKENELRILKDSLKIIQEKILKESRNEK